MHHVAIVRLLLALVQELVLPFRQLNAKLPRHVECVPAADRHQVFVLLEPQELVGRQRLSEAGVHRHSQAHRHVFRLAVGTLMGHQPLLL